MHKQEERSCNKNERKGGEETEENNQPPLMALNHVSRLCRDVKKSIEFYTKVLGFVLIEKPQVLDFEGAWLFNYGVGIHLVQSKEEQRLPSNTDQQLDPQDNRISFQCEDVVAMEKKLKEMNVKYKKRTLEAEDGTTWIKYSSMTQMDSWWKYATVNLKLNIPATSQGNIKLPMDRHTPPMETNQNEDDNAK